MIRIPRFQRNGATTPRPMSTRSDVDLSSLLVQLLGLLIEERRMSKPLKRMYTATPRPTGPYDPAGLPEMVEPDENHPEWEEEEVTYIGPTIDKYHSEHSHRTPATAYA